MRLSLLVVSTFCGSSTPPTVTNCVVTLLYHAWWSDGARKPVLAAARSAMPRATSRRVARSEEHTSELQSHHDLVCRPLPGKKKRHPETPEDHTLELHLHHNIVTRTPLL